MEKSLEELYGTRDFTEIVNRFERFLGRYKEIFNPRSSTGKVIGLCNRSVDIWRTVRYLTHTMSSSEIHQMRMSIIDTFGEEEMNQVIYLAFLETLDKFDPKRKVPLEKYIYNYYPYVLTAEIVKLAGPKQLLNDAKLSSYNSDEEYDEDSDDDDDYALRGLLASSELDYRWVDGITCDEPFRCLTSLERKLLLMIYVERRTHEDIAKDMRYHFSSIKRKKNEILEKLAQRIEELDEEIY